VRARVSRLALTSTYRLIEHSGLFTSHSAPAAQLEGERLAVSSEQTAVPGSPSSFNITMMPALYVQITAPTLKQVPHPYSPTVQQRGGTRTLKPSRIMRNFQFNEPAANSGNHAPRLAPDLQLLMPSRKTQENQGECGQQAMAHPRNPKTPAS
jgi:hypothetical protein